MIVIIYYIIIDLIDSIHIMSPICNVILFLQSSAPIKKNIRYELKYERGLLLTVAFITIYIYVCVKLLIDP